MTTILFSNLPSELYLRVIPFLRVVDLFHVGYTSRSLSHIFFQQSSIYILSGISQRERRYRKESVWWTPVFVESIEPHKQTNELYVSCREPVSDRYHVLSVSCFSQFEKQLKREEDPTSFPRILSSVEYGSGIFHIGYLFYRPLTDYVVGMNIDAMDSEGVWFESTIQRVQSDQVLVHYRGWSSRWDEWYRRDSIALAPFRTFTKEWRSTQLEIGQCCEVKRQFEGMSHAKWFPGVIVEKDMIKQTISVYFTETSRGKGCVHDIAMDSDDLCQLGTHVPRISDGYQRRFQTLHHPAWKLLPRHISPRHISLPKVCLRFVEPRGVHMFLESE